MHNTKELRCRRLLTRFLMIVARLRQILFRLILSAVRNQNTTTKPVNYAEIDNTTERFDKTC